MDDFNLNESPANKEPEPIPFDDSDDSSKADISHSPLNLGNGSPSEVATEQPVKKTIEDVVSSDRITGVKTFFTKLHAGAIDFLNGQINNWLKENPGIVIKRTNTVVGEVSAKKTEPNIIITVWY